MAINVQPRVRGLAFGAAPVANIGRSLRFYASVFSVQLERLLNANVQGLQRGLPEIAVIQDGDFRFGLALQYEPLPAGRPSVTWGIGMGEGEIERTTRALDSARVGTTDPDPLADAAHIKPILKFADPDGNVWTICSAGGAKRIAFAQVEATDLAEAEAFYTGLLGLSMIARAETHIVFGAGSSDTVLVVQKAESLSPRIRLTKGPHIALEVDNGEFHDLVSGLPDRERYWERETTKVPWSEPWSQVAYFYDPSYNRLALVVR